MTDALRIECAMLRARLDSIVIALRAARDAVHSAQREATALHCSGGGRVEDDLEDASDALDAALALAAEASEPEDESA